MKMGKNPFGFWIKCSSILAGSWAKSVRKYDANLMEITGRWNIFSHFRRLQGLGYVRRVLLRYEMTGIPDISWKPPPVATQAQNTEITKQLWHFYRDARNERGVKFVNTEIQLSMLFSSNYVYQCLEIYLYII